MLFYQPDVIHISYCYLITYTTSAALYLLGGGDPSSRPVHRWRSGAITWRSFPGWLKLQRTGHGSQDSWSARPITGWRSVLRIH